MKHLFKLLSVFALLAWLLPAKAATETVTLRIDPDATGPCGITDINNDETYKNWVSEHVAVNSAYIQPVTSFKIDGYQFDFSSDNTTTGKLAKLTSTQSVEPQCKLSMFGTTSLSGYMTLTAPAGLKITKVDFSATSISGGFKMYMYDAENDMQIGTSYQSWSSASKTFNWDSKSENGYQSVKFKFTGLNANSNVAITTLAVTVVESSGSSGTTKFFTLDSPTAPKNAGKNAVFSLLSNVAGNPEYGEGNAKLQYVYDDSNSVQQTEDVYIWESIEGITASDANDTYYINFAISGTTLLKSGQYKMVIPKGFMKIGDYLNNEFTSGLFYVTAQTSPESFSLEMLTNDNQTQILGGKLTCTDADYAGIVDVNLASYATTGGLGIIANGTTSYPYNNAEIEGNSVTFTFGNPIAIEAPGKWQVITRSSVVAAGPNASGNYIYNGENQSAELVLKLNLASEVTGPTGTIYAGTVKSEDGEYTGLANIQVAVNLPDESVFGLGTGEATLSLKEDDVLTPVHTWQATGFDLDADANGNTIYFKGVTADEVITPGEYVFTMPEGFVTVNDAIVLGVEKTFNAKQINPGLGSVNNCSVVLEGDDNGFLSTIKIVGGEGYAITADTKATQAFNLLVQFKSMFADADEDPQAMSIDYGSFTLEDGALVLNLGEPFYNYGTYNVSLAQGSLAWADALGNYIYNVAAMANFKSLPAVSIVAPDAPVYAGVTLNEEGTAAAGLGNIVFDVAGASNLAFPGPEGDLVATLTYGDKIVKTWNSAEELKGEEDDFGFSKTLGFALTGVTSEDVINPGTYTLNLPEGFITFVTSSETETVYSNANLEGFDPTPATALTGNANCKDLMAHGFNVWNATETDGTVNFTNIDETFTNRSRYENIPVNGTGITYNGEDYNGLGALLVWDGNDTKTNVWTVKLPGLKANTSYKATALTCEFNNYNSSNGYWTKDNGVILGVSNTADPSGMFASKLNACERRVFKEASVNFATTEAGDYYLLLEGSYGMYMFSQFAVEEGTDVTHIEGVELPAQQFTFMAGVNDATAVALVYTPNDSPQKPLQFTVSAEGYTDGVVLDNFYMNVYKDEALCFTLYKEDVAMENGVITIANRDDLMTLGTTVYVMIPEGVLAFKAQNGDYVYNQGGSKTEAFKVDENVQVAELKAELLNGAAVFTIDGRRVKAADRLERGIYILNGHKVLVK